MSRIPSTGSTPAGLHGEDQASRWVRRMFDAVAPRYDLLNHLLSCNIDRLWRSRTVRRLQPILGRPGLRAADLCCGSGDLLIALQRHCSQPVLGGDFSHPMLRRASAKLASRRFPSLLFEGDAMQLPLASDSLDLVTAAFGFRNLANYRKGLDEMLRVLAPGGTLAILEFSTPPNPAFRALYEFYSARLLPRIGGWISGSPEAYSYLPESVRKFPGAEALAASMREVGFGGVTFHRMSFGIVALHVGVKQV